MPRLLKIALLTVMVFLGATLSGAGVHFWIAARRTTVTFFDTLPAASTEDEGLSCGYPDPWFDWDFILQRTAAAAALAFGLALFGWAVALMKRKHDYHAAT